MRLKLTILLLILNVLLFGLIYYLEKDTGSETEGVGSLFPEGVVANSDRIEIEGRTTGLNWVLEKDNEAWRLSRPIKWKANFYAVNRILNQLQFLESETAFSVKEIERSGQTLAEYGLVDPRAVLTLGYGNREMAIKIGEPTEIGNRLYVLSPDEQHIHVVNRELLTSISLGLSDLRSQEIFTIPLFEVRAFRMSITNPGNLIVRLERVENSWRIVTPIQTAADTTRVENAIMDLSNLRILDFQPTELARQGLDDASVGKRVSLEGNNRRQTILVGDPLPGDWDPPRFYARLAQSDTVFTVEQAPFEALPEAVKALRDKNFLQLQPSRLTAIDIDVSDRTISLQRLETGRWQVPERDPEGALISWPADPEVMEDVLSSLGEVVALDFISDAPGELDLKNYGLTDPQRRITLIGDTEKVLLLGDSDIEGRRIFAKMEEEPFIYLVDSEILRPLQTRSLYYRSRILEEQPGAARIVSLHLARLDTGTNLLALDAGDSPSSDLLTDAFAEDLSDEQMEAARILLTYCTKFTIKEYLKRRFENQIDLHDKVVPWKFRMTVQFLLPGGSRTAHRALEIYYSERLGGSTQIGGSPRHKMTFSLRQDLMDALFTFTFDRTPPRAEEIEPPRDEGQANRQGSPSGDPATSGPTPATRQKETIEDLKPPMAAPDGLTTPARSGISGAVAR